MSTNVTAAVERVREFLRIVPIGRPHVGDGAIASVSGLGSLTIADLRTVTDAASVPVIDATHIEHQRAWSTATFGPAEARGPRGPLAHIRKELEEVDEDPSVLEEWVDVIILAFDGAWRAGHEPQAIIDAVKAKQARNEAREWPDWRGVPGDQAIEHLRHLDPCPVGGFHAYRGDTERCACGAPGPELPTPPAEAEEIEDGFGGYWTTCGTGCDLQVVRPGKVQCNRRSPSCPDRPTPPTEAEGQG